MTTAIAPDALSRLSRLVADWTGLHFPENKYADLERGIVRASRELGHRGVEPYVRSLLDASASAAQIQRLAWHLTIGETYFLRGETTFELLQTEVLPELVEKRAANGRHLRIWSAGCSCGEEPYSLAIIVTRLLRDLRDWRVTIVATDLNTRALEKAAEGVYGEWSFRGTPDWLRQRFFTRAGEGKWAVRPEIKEMVTFAYHNLATDPLPSHSPNTYGMDLVCCRNVLMYLKESTIRRVSAGFHEALRDGGYFFVAPGEASGELFPEFLRQVSHGETFFKKDDAAVAAAGEAKAGRAEHGRPQSAGSSRRASRASTRHGGRPSAVTKPVAKPVVAAAGHAPAAAKAVAPAGKADARPAADDTPAAGLMAAARSCADEGRLDEALERCQQAIAADKMSAGSRYLQATILEELGRADEAVQALTSALYLDPDLVLAHFLLGTILRRRRRTAEARREYSRTLELLEGLAPDAELPDSEGLTADRLAEIVRPLLAKKGA